MNFRDALNNPNDDLNNFDNAGGGDDLAAFDAATGETHIPAGVYACAVARGEVTLTKQGKQTYRLAFEVTDGPHRGFRLWRYFTFNTPAAANYAKKMLAPLGLKTVVDLRKKPFPEAGLHEVAAAARVAQYAAGDVVHEANAPLATVGFVLRGRLKAVKVDDRGGESLFRMIERGEQFGMMVGALTEPVPIRVVALEPTTVLNLDYDEAMELTFRHPDLRRLWLSTFAGSLRKHFFGSSQKARPMVLALIHESPAAREATGRLLDRLRGLGEKLAVFSDSSAGPSLPDVPFRLLRADGVDLEPEEVRRQAAAWSDANRIIFDLSADTKPERMQQAPADQAAWSEFVRPITNWIAFSPIS